MKTLLTTTALLVATTSASAQSTDVSAMIASGGLAATGDYLAALPDPDATERFALGGVRFLSAIEGVLQTRHGIAVSSEMLEMSGLPLLRLPVPPNPDAAPFGAAMVTGLFADAIDDLALALPPLDTIADDDTVALTIGTADIWFDIDADGARGPGEGLLDVAGAILAPQMGAALVDPDAGAALPAPASVVVRFDTADAAWLSAYAHLLSGVSEAVVAVDPTDAIDRVMTSRRNFAAIGAVQPRNNWFDNASLIDPVDLLSMVVFALDGVPDAVHARAAHDHFLAMIADNRTFWYRVATETDDDMEWIPNKTQTSALPIDFPAETGAQWQAVLADAERLLTGEALLPYWRLRDHAGLNLAALMRDPPNLDLIGLIQGESLLPYVETGPRVDGNNLRMFEQLVSGDAGLFMVILN